jgi:glycerol-3-phosphate cytidylyltransferase
MHPKKPSIVYTSGSWDMFHVGHLNILERSKALGDTLIVGVSTDELICDYKGMPPVIPFEERCRIVEAVRYVDRVVKQTVLTEIAQLRALDVDIVTIGSDWKDRALDGLDWMKKQPNKRVVYFDYTPNISTTSIKKRIIDNTYSIIESELRRELNRMKHWRPPLDAAHEPKA